LGNSKKGGAGVGSKKRKGWTKRKQPREECGPEKVKRCRDETREAYTFSRFEIKKWKKEGGRDGLGLA